MLPVLPLMHQNKTIMKKVIKDSIEKSNFEYLDLYDTAIADYVVLGGDSRFIDIVDVVNRNNSIGYRHYILVGGNCVIAYRKYSYSAYRQIKTSYIHIYFVTDFRSCKVLKHYREQKNGNFKLM